MPESCKAHRSFPKLAVAGIEQCDGRSDVRKCATVEINRRLHAQSPWQPVFQYSTAAMNLHAVGRSLGPFRKGRPDSLPTFTIARAGSRRGSRWGNRCRLAERPKSAPVSCCTQRAGRSRLKSRARVLRRERRPRPPSARGPGGGRRDRSRPALRAPAPLNSHPAGAGSLSAGHSL